ncbi:transcription-repair coupling factor [Thiomicrospira sp. WB1]|uniref:transcription-repair coupling factor n=1 Tax=Thiomicrospira sp. WB1 TaxID=1685380 RepID=UPI00074AC262|nr:transcription-repair coupling factor [Thiomicrospira sp. WB1]KUJ72005.1 transcription-repair coupling factor [Thiomicrospira sp. WB1]
MSQTAYSLLSPQFQTASAQTEQQWWHLPHPPEQALAITAWAQKSPGLVVLLTPDMTGADQMTRLLRFFAPSSLPVIGFPEWETLPYDQFSPHQDIISQRLKTLYQLPRMQQGILVLPINTLMQRVVPADFIEQYTFLLATEQTLDVDALIDQLEVSGYQRVNQVMEHGEFAIRGALIDLFPMGAERPYRLDLFDDEIETIRCFDPETQRSTDQVERIELLPAKEYDLSAKGLGQFRQQCLTHFGENVRESQLYRTVKNGHTLDGLEYYLPLFFEQTATLFDYLPEASQLVMAGDLSHAMEVNWADFQERYDIARHNPDYPVLPPQELILPEEALKRELAARPRIHLIADLDTASRKADKHKISFQWQPVPDLSIQSDSDYPLARLNAFLDQYREAHHAPVIFVAESAGRRETLVTLLKRHKLVAANQLSQPENWDAALAESTPYRIVIGPLEHSLVTPEMALIAEADIFGQTVIQKRRRRRKHNEFDQAVANLIELDIGQPVVHYDHGVGRYLGLETMSIQGEDQEFLMIEYAGEAKLYVPVTSLHLISRYTGANADTAPLHKLGSDKWEKAKKKAAEKVRDVAAELLDIYAQREARKGHAFDTDEDAYTRFAAAFPFEETPDQEAAIDAVVADMRAERPMDRLVCGDVGFGKTEVAMRAAFIAAYSGKQVAILVPTTLLSQQHLESFRDRFADWPMRIEGLSRFQNAKETQAIMADVSAGNVDILIGTHKLIQKTMDFKNLGLIIIDEEHRFGVRQKEQLKKLRASVDVLTMTATPIPRTLNMAMNDLRDLSIIATAPAKRLAVQTFVQQWNRDVVREACLREIRRGGQVYVLFNEVDKIEAMAEDIQTLLPEVRVSTAHGQMHETELERVMQDFYHRRFQILVCSTIIETGIDIPTANTILIHRADKFGLAQLHQLRGRVGRSHHKAYAYLFTPGTRAMTEDARKRLDAIARHDTLGAGFMLASHDLEIRGAGELLGDGQSGQIQEVGFSLYSELLDRAVKALKSGQSLSLDQAQNAGVEVTLGVPTLIPEDYLPDIHTRLVFYKRIASAENAAALNELKVEMIDRFGLLPTQVHHLLEATALKLKLAPLNLEKVEAHDSLIRIQFGAHPNIDPAALIQLIQAHPKYYQLKGQSELKYFADMPEVDERLAAIETIAASLKPDADPAHTNT